MNYNYKEKKVTVVLASNLEAGVALNVLGHLTLAIGKYSEPEIMGRPKLVDKSGIEHLGISKYPVIVTKVKPGRLRRAIQEAREKQDILVADYPKEMLTTGHDDELAEAISAIPEDEMEYLGAVFYGDATQIDEVAGRFMLWR